MRYYDKVLGLKGRVITKEDIKRRYIELCKQYNPDRVGLLDPKLKELAENKIREINEVYAYYKKQYGM